MPLVKDAGISTLTLSCFLISLSSSGQWTLMDNFQQWSDGNIFLDANDIGWHATAPHGSDEYWMLADPYDPSNTALYVEPGYDLSGYGNVYLMKELPDNGITPGKTGTLYFRCLWSGIGNNWHMGTADKELAFDEVTGLQTTPGAWGDFNALIRLGEAQNLEHRDGGGYVSTNPPMVYTINKWYQFWMVVENTWDDSTTPPTSTGTHTLYAQGPGFGDGESPTLIPVGSDPPKDSASIRRAPADEEGNPQAIIWAMFATNSPPGGGGCAGPDIYLLDDFYFSPGKNLSDPQSQPCEYCPDENGDLDTGNWMGWINITLSPFLWSYSLNCWFYMQEPPPDAPGGWGYFYK